MNWFAISNRLPLFLKSLLDHTAILLLGIVTLIDFYRIYAMAHMTPAEKMRAYRKRMSDDRKEEMKMKNREQQANSRKKWDSDKKKIEIEKSKVRMKQSRNRRKADNVPTDIPLSESTPSKAYKSAQSLGKAMKKVSTALPRSPGKKLAVVKRLASKFGLRINLTEKPVKWLVTTIYTRETYKRFL